jgi:hypothetical protein
MIWNVTAQTGKKVLVMQGKREQDVRHKGPERGWCAACVKRGLLRQPEQSWSGSATHVHAYTRAVYAPQGLQGPCEEAKKPPTHTHARTLKHARKHTYRSAVGLAHRL